MSQEEYTKRHKQKHPESESRRKARQRQKESVLRMHIKRNHLYGYGFPPALDCTSAAFRRVKREYLEQLAEPVEVVVER